MCTICQALSPQRDYRLHDDLAASSGPSAPPVSVTRSATFTETTDAPATPATPYTLTDDAVFSGSVDVPGDVDWIEVSLDHGANLFVQQDNISLGANNAFLELYDSTGTRVVDDGFYDTDEAALTYYNDTGSARTLYISASSFSGTAGDYRLTALIQDHGVGTADEIAEYLTHGLFGTPVAHDAAAGDAIRVDLTDLDPDEAALALEALASWSMVTGLAFAAEDFDITGNSGITFLNDDAGDPTVMTAHAGPDRVIDNVIAKATVVVTSAWVDTYGTGHDDYAFLTYLHEIGHALGLDHAGPYDGAATYSATPGGDTLFSNDSYMMTLMSYFSVSETAGETGGTWFPVTPMIADIKAARALYGVDETLRAGDTTYGLGSTAGGYFDDLLDLTGPVGLTLIDDGGTDTIDLSPVGTGSTIDLTPGATSSIAGLTDNMVIFDTTVIENLATGAGDDRITGNAAANSLHAGGGDDVIDGGPGRDRLTGGPGDDVFMMRPGEGGDTITDFETGTVPVTGDRIDVSAYDLTFDEIAFRQDTGGLRVAIDSDTLLLEGTRDPSLDISDFIGLLPRGGQYLLSGQLRGPDGAGLPGGTMTFTTEGAQRVATSDNEGRFTFDLAPGVSGRLEAGRAHGPGDPDIGVGDALDVLRLAVGLDPSWGPAEGRHYVAADIDRDGRVTVSDALDVLRAAVGLETDAVPRWVAFDADTDFSCQSATDVDVAAGVDIATLTDPQTVDMTAILLGHMEGYA